MVTHGSLYLLIEQPAFSKTPVYEDFVGGVMSRLSRGTALNIIDTVTPDIKCELSGKRDSSSGSSARIIAAGSTDNWISDNTSMLVSLGIHTVVVPAPADMPLSGWSGVGFDLRSASAALISHLLSTGRTRIALFGMCPGLHTARMIAEGCLPSFIGSSSGLTLSGHIQATGLSGLYINEGSIRECVRLLRQDISTFDAVLCLNDYSALCLMNALVSDGIAAGTEMAVASFGNTLTGQVSAPALTSAAIDYREAGRKAVEICNSLDRDASLSSTLANIKCTITVRGSSCGRGRKALPQGSPSGSTPQGFTGKNLLLSGIWDPHDITTQFYNDPDISEVISLEYLLRSCDDFDGLIIRDIAGGIKYEDMAERLNMSEKTIQYRLNKMLSASRTRTRTNLISLIEKHLGSAASAGGRIYTEKKKCMQREAGCQ